MRVGKKFRVKLNIVSTNYRVYPLVSNNVGIDFTELGPPHGSELGQSRPLNINELSNNENQDGLITKGLWSNQEKRQSFRTMLM
jgi:hypothetical protein